jgi:GT2 family glycosyltransferase
VRLQQRAGVVGAPVVDGHDRVGDAADGLEPPRQVSRGVAGRQEADDADPDTLRSTPVGSVRVGIVSWNTADLLDRCLRALPDALDGLDAEVVVVDNASDDGSASVAERHVGVRVVRNDRNCGYPAAMNQALVGADGDVLIALNPDTEPPARSLRTLVERLLAAPDVGLVAPRLIDPDGTLQHSAYRFPSLALATIAAVVPPFVLRRGLGRRWWIHGYAPHDRSADVEWLVGAVHVVRAAAVAPDPPYRESWFMYAEDLDLCHRLARAGWRRRLEADVAVAHVGNAAGEQAWGDRRVDRSVSTTAAWYAEAHGRPAARLWAALHVLGLVLRLAMWTPGARRDRRRGRAPRHDTDPLAPQLRAYARAVLTGPGGR